MLRPVVRLQQFTVHFRLSQNCSQTPIDTQYETAARLTGWAAMAKTVRDFDEEKIRDCKEDIDTLLVFVSRYPRTWYEQFGQHLCYTGGFVLRRPDRLSHRGVP